MFARVSAPSSSSSVSDLAIRIALRMGRTDVCVMVEEEEEVKMHAFFKTTNRSR